MKFMHEWIMEEKKMVDKEVEKEVEGKKVKVKEPTEEFTPHTFYLLQPTRSIKDSAAVYYAVETSKLVNAGVMTRPMLRKHILNVGGSLSEEEKKAATELYDSWFNRTNEFQRVAGIEESKKTPEEKKRAEDLQKELIEIQRKVQDFETQQQSLFDLCAESIANNRSVIWHLVMLSYKKNEKGEAVPVFNGETIDQKLDQLDEMDESNDEFLIKCKNELLLYVTIYTQGLAAKKEDFISIRKRI